MGSFQKRMAASESQVHEVLQLWGDFPDCAPAHSCEMDWLHALLSNLNDAAEQARLIDSPEHDESQTVHALRRKLAAIAKTCEMWDAKLAKEFPGSAVKN